MKNFGMKIISLFVNSVFSAIFFSLSICAQSDLETAKNNFVNDPWLAHASIGFCVTDLSTKTKIISHNDQVSLPPASTVKLFSTASAFEILGSSYRPKTRLYAPKGIDANGIISGDLWIRGGGDVSLGSRYYNEENELDQFLHQWADSLYGLGLRKIEGDVIGDASEFGYQGAPDGWNWADMGNYYGAGPSGLPIYDNMLRFYLKVGGKVGTKAILLKIFPEVEGLHFNNYIEAAASKGDNSYVYGAPYSLDRFGTGYLPRNSSSFMVKGSLPDPELQFASELIRVFRAHGIQVSGQPRCFRNMNQTPAYLRYKSMSLVYLHQGRTIKSLAFWTNMKSVNVYAEQLICMVARENGLGGDTKSATDFLERYWARRIDAAGLNLKDGSGLSRSNGITASNFCSLLCYMHTSASAADFRESLPIAGESGTLSKICYGQAAHGRVWAKSGTMNKIKAYSGYVKTITGKELAFSIIVNNYSCSNDDVVEKIEALMNAMAKY